MFLRSILPIAAVVALAIAGPAAAQTRVVTPDGKGSMVLPQGMERHPLANDADGKISVIIRLPGQTGLDWGGICVASFSTPDSPTTKENWALIASMYSSDPEGKGRERATKNGHSFTKLVENRSLTSNTGWAGWFFAYQQVHKDGTNQTLVNTGSQLTPTLRLIASCTSDSALFTKTELDLIHRFVASASAN